MVNNEIAWSDFVVLYLEKDFYFYLAKSIWYLLYRVRKITSIWGIIGLRATDQRINLFSKTLSKAVQINHFAVCKDANSGIKLSHKPFKKYRSSFLCAIIASLFLISKHFFVQMLCSLTDYFVQYADDFVQSNVFFVQDIFNFVQGY